MLLGPGDRGPQSRLTATELEGNRQTSPLPGQGPRATGGIDLKPEGSRQGHLQWDALNPGAAAAPQTWP